MDCHVYPTWDEANAAGWSVSGRHATRPGDRVAVFRTSPRYIRGLQFDRAFIHGAQPPPPDLLLELLLTSNRVEVVPS